MKYLKKGRFDIYPFGKPNFNHSIPSLCKFDINRWKEIFPFNDLTSNVFLFNIGLCAEQTIFLSAIFSYAEVVIAGLFSVQRHNHTANYERKLKLGMEVSNTCIK